MDDDTPPPLLHNFLARAVYLLVDIRADLLKYENDSTAQGFVCDINDYLQETYASLQALAAEQPRKSPSPSSAPLAGGFGGGWKAPTSPPGEPSAMNADADQEELSQSPPTEFEDSPAPTSSPAPSFVPPLPSSKKPTGLDFF